MSRRWIAAVAVSLALTACAENAPRQRVQPTDLPSTPPASVTPSATVPPVTTTPTATATPGRMRVAVYYLGDATFERRPKLYREFRSVTRTTGVVRAAVDAMLHLTPLDGDYYSLWPQGARVNGVSISGNVATVDLSENARSVRATQRQERASLQQLVHTVTAAAPSVTGVRVRFDGQTKPTLWGSVDTSRTLNRGAPIDTLASIWVVEPAIDARVARTFTVKGTASTFEGSVSWVVTRPGSATAIVSGHAQATEGAPGRGSWTATVRLPVGTTGDIVFKAYESSAQDGSELDPDTKKYRVA